MSLRAWKGETMKSMSRSVLAVVALTATLHGVFAAPNKQTGEQGCKSRGGAWVSDGHRRKGFCSAPNVTIKGSQANQNQQAPTPPADAAAAAKACADRGGTITTDNFCAVRNVTIIGSQANQNQQAPPADAAAAAKACADSGGTITTDASGSTFCAAPNIKINGAQ
jgi:hypothetical protein